MTFPNWETLIFPTCREKIEIPDMQSIHIQIRPSWTNSWIHINCSCPTVVQPFTQLCKKLNTV